LDKRLVSGIALALLSIPALAGCGGGGGGLPEGEVALLETASPLRDPVLGPVGTAFFALDEGGGDVFSVEVPNGGVGEDLDPPPSAEPIEGAGENLASGGPQSDFVFVPQPGLNQVQAVEKSDLLEAHVFTDLGENPVRVATDREGRELYTLSADGQSVSAVGLETYDALGRASTDGGEESLLEAAEGEGQRFWLAGPGGVALHDLEGGLRASSDLDAAALATDPVDAGRAYAAEADSGRVVALDAGGPAGRGLDTAAEADVGEEVLYLEADGEGRLYALTGRRLLLLDSGSLEVVEEVDLATEEVRSAGVRVDPSGLAVSDRHAFVTLEGTPHALLVGKPAGRGG